jgi:hypothetical protein
MHQGLTDVPFVPHNPISTQESPVPLLKFQMASIFKILMSSWSMKGTQIYFSFLSNNRTNEPPPVSPTGPLWREILVYRAFCISLEDLIKIPLNKMALRKKRPSLFPEIGAPREAEAHFRALLDISFGVPSKGALPQGPLHGILAERCPRARHSSFKVPGI